jgi:hypothetical protein
MASVSRLSFNGGIHVTTSLGTIVELFAQHDFDIWLGFGLA